ncbi:MAG: 50S ribosomal protein L29 [Porticoccaceae bacterium]|nr:50S ribosomal protein L29 [Porticoccaceae bacterium]
MKASELQQKSVDELQGLLGAELENQFKLRMQKATGQLGQSHKIGETRKNIARIKTVLNQKAGN